MPHKDIEKRKEYNKEYYRKKVKKKQETLRENGFCSHCFKNIASYGSLCETCYLISDKRKQQAALEGRCIDCNKPKSDNGFLQCEVCLLRKRQYGQILRENRASNNQCQECGTTLTDEFASCNNCLKKERKKYQVKVEERRKQGICDKCAKNLPEPGRFRCRKCLDYHRMRNLKIRDEAFAAYGGYKCACCGESNKWFLTIDHINNDGAQHRKIMVGGYNICDWLKKNGFPPGFQVLCCNCNFAKGRFGSCPHTWDKDVVLPPEIIYPKRCGERKNRRKPN